MLQELRGAVGNIGPSQACEATKQSEIENNMIILQEKIVIISDKISQLAIRTAGVRAEMPVKSPSSEQTKRIPASPLVEVLRQFSDSLQGSINQAQDILDSLQL